MSSNPLALWVVPRAELGGVARHVIDVARHGVPGHRLVVLCPEGPLVGRLREVGANVATGRFGPTSGLAASVLTLRRVTRALRPAVVHSHLAYADIVLAATALPGGTMRVSTEHGIAGDARLYHSASWRASMMAAVHRCRLRRFDRLIAVSEATRAAMVAAWRAGPHVQVIHNGVDMPTGRPRVGPAGSARPRILSLSRLAPEKRIDRLLEAFAVLRHTHPEATLTIAGLGPLERDLRALVSRLGLGDAVRLPGFVDAGEALSRADVLVQLSVWENCSYALLDAAAWGLGIVASDVGGNPEILSRGSLVDADDVVGVAAAIERATHTDPLIPDWTVSQMCQGIATAYRGAGQ
jgi:glycosyltransferase involved in cell wall biosynthesis